jgi:hypothetical protein
LKGCSWRHSLEGMSLKGCSWRHSLEGDGLQTVYKGSK